MVRFAPLEDNVANATFELNNALNISRVTDESGRQIPASRSQQDSTVRLSFDQPLAKGKPKNVTFDYDGRLTGNEDSPVYGIKFAAIHNDYAYLMYPARWFPISGYTTDRYSAEMNITVATGNRVIASGLETSRSNGDKTIYSFQFDEPSFPGSIAVLHGEPKKVNSEGVITSVCFRGGEQSMANVYGQETGKIITYFTATFGLPPYANLALVETEDGAPNGFSAPGVIFLNPRAIGHDVNAKLLANQISRQWWHALISPATRNHLWLTNGLAAYSELLYAEHTNGPGALETQFHDMAVEALTVDNVPVIQAARLEDYSPELWALTGRERRGRTEHAALQPGRRQVFRNAQAIRQGVRLEIGDDRGFQEGGRSGIAGEPGLLLHRMDRIQRRARVQAGVHDFPHAEGLPRDGQGIAGPRHVSHAGGAEDRDRRQS